MTAQTTVSVRPDTRIRTTWDAPEKPGDICAVYLNGGDSELLIWAPNYTAAQALMAALELCRETE